MTDMSANATSAMPADPAKSGPRSETRSAGITGSGTPRVYFLDNEYYFGGRDGIYGDARGEYGDNERRWAFFALAALTALPMVTRAPVMMLLCAPES